MTAMLRVPRLAALLAIATLILASAGVSFAESYRGLFEWSHEHGLAGTWAAIWPLQVDVFIAVGELALFVGLADRWPPRSRIAAWAVTGVGLVVSVAGNVGHVATGGLASRATAAVPPVAAAAALAVGLGVLKRVVASYGALPALPPAATDEPEESGEPGEYADEYEPDAEYETENGDNAPEGGQEAAEHWAHQLATGHIPSVRAIRTSMHIGQPKAQAIRDYLALLVPEEAGKSSS